MSSVLGNVWEANLCRRRQRFKCITLVLRFLIWL
nr:MAG TPA: hypothetical protein [Caudoviricetes sp.]